MRNFSIIELKKTILGIFTRENPDAYNSMKLSNQVLNKLIEEEMLRVLREGETRRTVQSQIVDIYTSSKFIPNEIRMKPRNLMIQADMVERIVGSGIPVKQDDYNYKEIQSTQNKINGWKTTNAKL